MASKPARRYLTGNQMNVCFEVRPGRLVGGVRECDARRVRIARRVTAARLRYYGLSALVDDAMLIVSELVTNAIVHSGGTQITFTMTVDDGFLHLAVHDQTPGRPTVYVDNQAERGRGLFLVDSLAAEHKGTWGTSDNGATTWCKLAAPGGRP
ncbi:ATP-binding protein [Streptomyces bobili]|uniref:ATP-binding protein n=1 Tax=Streptomyces bobili TaxID=67280 RepID=UPI003701828E